MALGTYTLMAPDNVAYAQYEEMRESIYLHILVTVECERMKGHAGRLLARLFTIADAANKRIDLSVAPLQHGPTTLPFLLLKEFYMRRGFEEMSYAFLSRRPLQSIATTDKIVYHSNATLTNEDTNATAP